jgi:cytolysin (calcineurin-like family phosphatase)
MSRVRLRAVLIVLALAVLAAVVWFAGFRPKGYDVTFFVVSDTHYGYSPTAAAANEKTIDAMNRLPGSAYPERVGGYVAEPRGVVVLGDLINDASGPDAERSWKEFTADFGVDGEGRLKFPVYELAGNHDGGEEGIVRQGIKERTKRRPGVTGVSMNGINYSWDWDGIHFVSLGLFAGSEGDIIANPWGRRMEGAWRLPGHSLEFLKQDLARTGGRSRRPVVLFQHYGWDMWGLGWWSDRERQALADAIRDINVVAIFWGHTHSVQKIDVDGIPTFCAGSGQKDPEAGVFMVVRLQPRELIAAVWKVEERDWGDVFRVPLPPVRKRHGA